MNVTYLGKLVGNTQGNRYITRRREEHYFRIFKGFGMSTQLIKNLRANKIETVTIIYEHKDGIAEALHTPLEKFYTHGKPWTDKQGDTQLILKKDEFTTL